MQKILPIFPLILAVCLGSVSPSVAQKGEFNLRVVDSETKKPIAFRLEVRNARGIAQRVERIPFLYEHLAVSADGVTMNFPVGQYPMKVERGLEYLPVSGHFVLNRSAKDQKQETLRRFVNLAEKGWWSGDLLVLREKRELETLMLADDVHFVPLANADPKQTGGETWFDDNRVYTTANYFLNHSDCGVTVLNHAAGFDFAALKLEEKKSPILALALLKQKDKRIRLDVVNADSWDLPLLLAMKWVDSFQLLGPHLLASQTLPGEVDWEKIPRLKKTAKLDTKRLIKNDTVPRPSAGNFDPELSPVRYTGTMGRQHWTEDVYFHLLNAGFKIPPSAGSGSGLSPNPVGANRMYVYVDRADYEASGSVEGFQHEGANAGFSPRCWWNALDAGAVVVTNGPLLQPRVDGCLPGFLFEYADENPVKLEVGLTLSTRTAIQYIDVIVNGRIQESIRFQEYAKTGRLPALELQESGWFMLRVVTDDAGTYCAAMTAPFYVQLGNKPNPRRRASAEFFYRWEVARVEMLEKSGAFEGKEGKKLKALHDYTLQFWKRRTR